MYWVSISLFAACMLARATGSHQTVAAHQTGSDGCGNSKHFIGKTRTFDIESNGTTRKFLVHLPDGYDKDSPTPALLAFHGRGSTARLMELVTRFSQSSINPDMIAVYPQGLGGSWEGPTYARPGVDDMLFADDLLKHLKNNYCIDESRIYASGYSNGGGLVDGLACSSKYSHQFAAFACVNSAYYLDSNGSVCNPQRSPVPIWSVHGTGDKIVPYDGGEGIGGPLPSIEDWVDRWTGRNDCIDPSKTSLSGDVWQTDWSCGAIDKLQRHYKMVGHGHNYPGPHDKIDASALIMDYFSESRVKTDTKPSPTTTEISPKPSTEVGAEPSAEVSTKPNSDESAATGIRFKGLQSKIVGLGIFLLFALEY